jgi:hypothetical protein
MIPLLALLVAGIVMHHNNHNYWVIAPAISLLLWAGFKLKFNKYNFNKRIISLTPDKNKKQGRVIGRCSPYYRKQLKYNNSIIVQDDLSAKGGTIVTGSSGSGKTYTLVQMMRQDIAAGKNVCYFDFKGDLSTLNEITKGFNDIEIFRLQWDNCNFVYDPLVGLDEGGKVEAILNMRKWSLDGNDDHYKTGVQLFLQKAVRDFKFNGNGNYLVEFYKFLKTYNTQKDLMDAYYTTLKLIELALTSKAGKMFDYRREHAKKFNFEQPKQYVLLVSFTSSTKTLGTSITSLMFRDLMERGTRNSYSPTLCLYVDEFGSCESPLVVKDILEKGRSCGIATVISMQDLNQLSISTNPAFVDSILGTINSCIIFAGATKTTAEQLSGVQIRELSDLLMTLTKPIPEEGRPPTAMFISKYPLYEKGGTEVYRFVPEVDEELLKTTYSKRTTAATNTQNQPTVQPEQEQATTTGQPKQGIANMYDTPRIKRDNDFSGFDAENYL